MRKHLNERLKAAQDHLSETSVSTTLWVSTTNEAEELE